MATLGHMLTIAAFVLSLAAIVLFALAVRQREVRWARLGRWTLLARFCLYDRGCRDSSARLVDR